MGRYSKKRGGLAPNRYLSEEQYRKLMKFVRGQGDLARLRGRTRGVWQEFIIEFLVGTGLRASEACNVLISDLPMSHGKPCVWVRNGKGNVTRVVDISQRLCDRTERFVRLHRKGVGPDAPLLVTERHRPMCYRCLHRWVANAGKRAGIGSISPHQLRHTFAVRLYGIERDLLFVKDQLGHASVSTTQIYAKTNSKDRRRQIEKLDTTTTADYNDRCK